MNKGPVASSFFQTLFLSWASLFVNAREIVNSQGAWFGTCVNYTAAKVSV